MTNSFININVRKDSNMYSIMHLYRGVGDKSSAFFMNFQFIQSYIYYI